LAVVDGVAAEWCTEGATTFAQQPAKKAGKCPRDFLLAAV
jgi:hypothetical protein